MLRSYKELCTSLKSCTNMFQSLTIRETGHFRNICNPVSYVRLTLAPDDVPDVPRIRDLFIKYKEHFY